MWVETAALSLEEVNSKARELLPKLVASLCLVPDFADSRIRALIALALSDPLTASRIKAARDHPDLRLNQMIIRRNNSDWAVNYLYSATNDTFGLSVIEIPQPRSRNSLLRTVSLRTTIDAGSSLDGVIIRSVAFRNSTTAVAGAEHFIRAF